MNTTKPYMVTVSERWAYLYGGTRYYATLKAASRAVDRIDAKHGGCIATWRRNPNYVETVAA